MEEIKTKPFITPQEYMKIQLKQLRLQKRLVQQSSTTNSKENEQDSDKSNICDRKRPNPFARDCQPERKKSRSEEDDEGIKSTIFELIHNTKSKNVVNLEEPLHFLLTYCQDEINGVAKEEKSDNEEEKEKPIVPLKFLPIDWSIKSRVRIMCPSIIIPTILKSSVEASSLTGFVRCLDVKQTSSGLDLSDGTLFHQNTMYWQYPHLPWLNLINRRANSNNSFKMEEKESELLCADWKDSFKNLFHLLRARQCPYFFFLANTYCILFRAAGVGGRAELHALMTPSTKGFRQMLKEEDIEFIQPLKKQTRTSTSPNTSLESEKSIKVETDGDDVTKQGEDENEEEEMDEVSFLESLGVKKSDIKLRENTKERQRELEDDHGDVSTVLVEGVDCQAFYDFLLNTKSIIPRVGKLAGIPPTLLAPVAFLGAALRKQKVRSSKLKLEGQEYFSVELSGAILPHTIHTLTSHLSSVKDNYNLTMNNYTDTVAFTKTSKKLMEDLNNSQEFSSQVFGRENLSDCGMSDDIVNTMCRVDVDAVDITERIQYTKRIGGFTYF